jgi:hypothetical protein
VNTGNPQDFDAGMREFETAERLFKSHTDPMDRRSGLLVEYGEALVYSGTPENIKLGIEKIEKALTPPDWYYWVASFAYYADGQLEKGREYQDKMKSRPGDPDFLFPALLTRAAILEELNDRDGAREAMVQYFLQGKRSLAALAERFGDSSPRDGVEKIFSNEFEIWGFKDEGKSELSRRWSNSLRSAFGRASDTLAQNGFNVPLINSSLR